MLLALELLAFIFVASIIPVIPTLLAIWYDRHTLRKQDIGIAKGIIAEMEHGPGATRASVGDGPLTLITIEQGGHIRTLDIEP